MTLSYALLAVNGKLIEGTVKRSTDNAYIPFDSSNTDYQQFKSDVASGIELQDSDGNVMTQKQVNDFLKTIP